MSFVGQLDRVSSIDTATDNRAVDIFPNMAQRHEVGSHYTTAELTTLPKLEFAGCSGDYTTPVMVPAEQLNDQQMDALTPRVEGLIDLAKSFKDLPMFAYNPETGNFSNDKLLNDEQRESVRNAVKQLRDLNFSVSMGASPDDSKCGNGEKVFPPLSGGYIIFNNGRVQFQSENALGGSLDFSRSWKEIKKAQKTGA